MARRGRPPREDGRIAAKVRINATVEELARIVDSLTPDERREVLIGRIDNCKCVDTSCLPIDTYPTNMV